MKRVFLSIVFAPFFLFGASGEGKQIPKDDVKQMAEVAVKSKNPSVASCAYGMYFEKGADMSSKLTIETIKGFAKKKGFFHKAAAIASFYDVTAAMPELQGYKDGELAASILAAKAYQNIMYEGAIIRSAPKDEGEAESEMSEKEKKRKDKKNQKKRKGKKGAYTASKKGIDPKAEKMLSLSIPLGLFTSRSTKTQYLTILAAAYSRQKEYATTVAEVAPKSAEIMAAQILYKVMGGGAPSVKEVRAAFDKSMRMSKPIEGSSGMLSYIDMNVPAMSTLMEALGRTKNKQFLPLIHKACFMKDERVKIDAVRALRKIADPSSIPYLIKMLDKSQWTTLIEICLALGEQPHKSALVPLIKRFAKETGRFRLDVNYALSSIAGERKGYKPDEWVAWYKKEGKAFQVDPAKSQAYRESTRLQDVGVPVLGGFYNIYIYSDRCSFIVDYSLSMKDDKIESLKTNLKDTVNGLRPNVLWNVVDFGGDVNVLYDGKLIDDKKKTMAYVDEMPLTGGTRSMDAIERGMKIPEVDTIYFLSDGAPVRGQMQKWESIHKLIKLTNRYRHVAVSAICF
ncbi:MAG: HEAT repeat domain-containing protein [Lentisphaerales bacterium]|nr:HEAT repeat domain-containing protein [Lentisphaerales bacterium]